MPVRRTIEIGGDRDTQRLSVATTLANEPRGVAEHQRRAVRRAEHHARMTAPEVGNGDSERAGELARLAAELQIALASRRGQLGNPHALDDFVRGEFCLEDPGRELGAFERPPSVRTGKDHLGIEGGENGWPFGCRVR